MVDGVYARINPDRRHAEAEDGPAQGIAQPISTLEWAWPHDQVTGGATRPRLSTLLEQLVEARPQQGEREGGFVRHSMPGVDFGD